MQMAVSFIRHFRVEFNRNLPTGYLFPFLNRVLSHLFEFLRNAYHYNHALLMSA
jgi:hypothetical protein